LYRILVLVLFSCITSVGSAKGFADRFRDFVLDSDPRVSNETVALPGALAVTSRQCMACHDGSGGRAIAVKGAESPMRYRGNHNVDHPVGMNYAGYASRYPVEYVAPERLDHRILLEDGQVTCLSCHAIKTPEQMQSDGLLEVSHGSAGLYSKADCSATDRLTTGTHRTTLCLACHAM
jgi:hypothetical protein